MNIDKKYKWLARDKDGDLYSYENEPFKESDRWFEFHGSAKEISENDERFDFIRWNDDNPIRISNIGNILAIESKEDYHYGNEDNPLGISVEEAIKSIRSIDRVGIYDSNDVISKPSHYIGINGLEVEQILAEFLPRFTDGYEAHRVGSAIEYLLRSPLKNKGEDIEKAGQNIEQIKRYNQGKQA